MRIRALRGAVLSVRLPTGNQVSTRELEDWLTLLGTIRQ